MNNQNFKNHTRQHPLFHFFAAPLSLITLIGAIVNAVKSSDDNFYSALLLVVVVILIIATLLVARISALKAQNRAIKIEENFRHYLLTGKPFDSRLTMSQIISLRFAPDEEFLALAKKAVDEKLASKTIKESIKNWKGDYHRV
jgi:hypothetical protein